LYRLPEHTGNSLRMSFGLCAVCVLLVLSDAAFAHRVHRGESRLPAKMSVPSTHVENHVENKEQPDPAQPATVSADHEALRRIVREELERVLPPLLERNRETAPHSGHEEEQTLREILGGLGWIAGLAALFAWYRRRRAS
jgi:hypothetical protein